MRMACSGFRPAYNVQLASTNKGKAIVAVDVINKGSDSGQAPSMLEHIRESYNMSPKKYLVDTGYDIHKGLEEIQKKFPCTEIYAPLKHPSKSADCPKVIQDWEIQMSTEEAKQIYQERAATAEYVNAVTRNDGLQQFVVRGINKVTCVVLLHAIAHNMTIAFGI